MFTRRYENETRFYVQEELYFFILFRFGVGFLRVTCAQPWKRKQNRFQWRHVLFSRYYIIDFGPRSRHVLREFDYRPRGLLITG